MMRIIPGDFGDPRLIDLLRTHLERMRAETPEESVHALDLTGLQSPDISFWTIWDGEMLLGMGALRRLAPDRGEVKSMRTVAALQRRGVGSAMLRHIVAAAHAAGMMRLSLETGSGDYFAPARALYRRHGFVECPPFADYRLDPNSVFMTLTLAPAAT